MSTDRWTEIETLFERVLLLDREEREACYTAEEVDDEVRREVESLLGPATRAEHSLAQVIEGATVRLAEEFEPARTGERIGPYTIVDRIGEGGMAVVYRAEQSEPVARTVALKIIKVGLDTREILARFEDESRLLAKLDHPSIARILDAGATAEGRPYFVLELVDGVPITDYCDAHRLDVRARVELLVEVCRAVQHAHQKGVVHRDIKPSNILVEEVDGKPVPKVIDFGVAKTIDVESIATKAATRPGMVVGTWEYMSPEQARGSDDLDTRTDVYSLGIVLYELLTGSPPFERARLRKEGLARLPQILAREIPNLPSTRVMRECEGELAHRRGVEPQRLRRSLRGDLDGIALRALEGDRERRYASPLELAADLERHLRREPVTARPPTVRYRVSKFVDRNRPFVASAITVFVVLVAAMLFSVREARNAREMQRHAEEERTRAQHEAARARVSAALIASGIGRPLEARELLDDVPEEERAWEWRHARSTLDGSRVRIAGDRPFITTTLLADGVTLVSLDAAGTVERWNTWSGERRAASRLSVDGLVRARFDDDASHAVVVLDGDAPTLAVFETATGRQLATWTCSMPGVDGLAVAPDASRVAYWRSFPAARLWDPASQDPPRELHTLRTASLTLSGDGAVLMNGYNGDVLEHGEGWTLDYDGATGLPHGPAWRFEMRPVRLLALDEDGSTFAAAMQNGVWVGDRISKEPIAHLVGRSGMVLALALSPDGGTVVTGCEDATVRVWDVDSGGERNVLVGPDGPVDEVSIDAAGRIVALSGGRAWVWAPGRDPDLDRLTGHESYVYGVAFIDGGERLLSAAWDHTVRVWSATTAEEFGILSEEPAVLRSVAASRDTGVVAFSVGSRVELFHTPGLLSAGRLILGPRVIADLELDRTGRRIAVRTFARTWVLERASESPDADGTPVYVPIAGWRSLWERSADVALSPDGRRVATAALKPEGGVRLYEVPPRSEGVSSDLSESLVRVERDPAEGRHLLRPATEGTAPGTPFSLDFSPDGALLAVGFADGSIELWDVGTASLRAILDGHIDIVYALRFSPDGERLASGSNDKTVRIWDVAMGTSVATLSGHEDYVYDLDFSPDGSTIASASGDGAIRLWTTRPVRERISELVRREEARAAATECCETWWRETGDPAAVLERIAALPPEQRRTHLDAYYRVLMAHGGPSGDAGNDTETKIVTTDGATEGDDPAPVSDRR